MAWWSNSTPQNQEAHGASKQPLQDAVDKATRSTGQSNTKGSNGGQKQR